jgi:hypothetical protein
MAQIKEEKAMDVQSIYRVNAYRNSTLRYSEGLYSQQPLHLAKGHSLTKTICTSDQATKAHVS